VTSDTCSTSYSIKSKQILVIGGENKKSSRVVSCIFMNIKGTKEDGLVGEKTK
jgi:N-acetylneuraminic acid mutarotase